MRNWSLCCLGLVVLLSGCSVEISTANISAASMARDGDAKDKTTEFGTKDVIYCVVDLANAPEDTRVRAVWIAVKCVGAPENHQVEESTMKSSGGQISFKMELPNPWPVGSYKIDLYLNDKLDRTLEFQVK